MESSTTTTTEPMNTNTTSVKSEQTTLSSLEACGSVVMEQGDKVEAIVVDNEELEVMDEAEPVAAVSVKDDIKAVEPITSSSTPAIVFDASTGETIAVLVENGALPGADNPPADLKVLETETATSEETVKSEEPGPSVKLAAEDDVDQGSDQIVINIGDDDDDDDGGLLNDVVVDEEDDDVIYISEDDDESFKQLVQNAQILQKVKQSVEETAASYKPIYVSRQRLQKKHPKCAGMTFKEIMHQAILEDKILPDFNEQQIPRKIADKLRQTGHSLHRTSDNGYIISSKHKNIKIYHSAFSARFDPVLADPTLENYVQEYRKTLQPTMWRKESGRKEVDPSSVIPASIGSTGSSSIGSETDPECLATDEEESESELMQGSVAAWIIPDAIVSRTPSPEPDFDEPQFITTQVGSHTIVEGPPAKKRKQKHHEPQPHTDGKIYPKPAFSYSCLIAMALKNSKTGSLPVSEIYKFMCDHFPYFKSAPSGWKNSVRHNLSLNKCFEKIEKPGNGARKGCLWALNPAKIHKMDEEVQKWSRKDPIAIRRAMSDPENLELIERGELKRDYSGAGGSDDDEDEDFSEPATPLTPAQAQARRSRTNSSDSTLEGTTAVVTPVVTTVSQVHAALQRSVDPKSQVVKREDAVELGTITNIQGNYVCHTPNGNGTYTLSFANIGSSSPLTPIIIRRTPVK